MKILIIQILLCLFVSPAFSAVLDAPHNQANGIMCSSCHTYSSWWQYSPADTTGQTYSLQTNSICLSCHDGTLSNPVMQAHNSVTFGGLPGAWSEDCVSCHDPHTQDQLNWRNSNPSELFLVQGLIAAIDNGDGTFSYNYTDNGNNTTDIHISSYTPQPNTDWGNTTNWNKKNDNSTYNRGLIFVHGTSSAYNTYSLLGSTSSTITINGTFDPAGIDPSQDATFGLIYGQFIKAKINAATVQNPSIKAEKTVKFFDPNKLYTLGGFTDQQNPRQGICQVCHIGTSYWTEDGVNDGHNSTSVCTTCHLRHEGFKPTAGSHSETDGTFSWDVSCQICHQAQGTEKILSDVHKLGTANDCGLCHQSPTGGVPLRGSASNASIGSTPHSCSECHIDSYGQHHASIKAQNGDCTWCHADPRSSWETTFGVTGSKPRQLACRQCHIEQNGTGLVVYKLDFPVTPSDTMTFPFGDLSQPANNSKLVTKSAMDGSGLTTNHSISGSSKIDIYNFGACLSCHDGVTATQANVWHARPKYSEIPVDTDTDVSRMHFDVLKYAPGRSVFNLWRGDGQQGEPYFSHEEDFYDTSGAAATRGEDFFGAQDKRNIQWNWGATSSPFTLTQIPCFSSTGLGNDIEGLCGENSAAANEFVPVFDDGPFPDTIQVNQASYDGSNLLITATNTNGNLSVTYDDIDYGQMSALSGNRWIKNIPLAGLTSSTADIKTSNPFGVDALNYPICNEDLVTFVNAAWTPTAINEGTLTLTATNGSGASGQLDYSYNSTLYPMTYSAGQWTAALTQVAYEPTVDIFSQCGSSINNPVTDLSDNVQVNSASWDGTNLVLSVTNTATGATLWADYNGTTSIPLTESPANTWSLTSAQGTYAPQVRVWSNTNSDVTVGVDNVSPRTYPPTCDSADNRDTIFTPLDKARFDPNKNDELHVDAINLINTSFGAQLYMVYSETDDGNTRYNLPWKSQSSFEYKDVGFTWSSGSTVTVWSEDSVGTVMGIACSQPVFNRDLTDAVTVLKAEWVPDDGGTLVVHATNTGLNSLTAYMDYGTSIALQLAWSSTHQRWQLTMTGVGYSETVRVYTDGNGDTTVPVTNLSPDPITITQAAWSSDNNSDIFVVRATNTLGGDTQIYADYNGIPDLPLVWSPMDETWELYVSSTGYSPTVRLWSVRPGETSSAVSNMTGTHLNLTFDQECAVCHTDSDINFGIHIAICATCHQSQDPVVQNAVNSGNGGSCTTCHIPASGRINVSEVDFSEETITIALKDHFRPDSDIHVPIPQYIWDVRNEPTAVSKGRTVTLTTRFQALPGITSAVISSSLFGSQTVTFTNGISGYYDFVLPASSAATAGVKQINIDWQYCDENQTTLPDCQTPQLMHSTSHTLYVTHAMPAGQAPYYAKVVELSVQWSQDALSEQEIVDSISDGTWILGSYGYQYVFPFLGRTNNNVGDILRQKQGACGEWSAFLLRAIEVQGIDVYKVDIVPANYDQYIVQTAPLGNTNNLWFYGDHAFVIYGADIADVNNPYIGKVYDPSFNMTATGWGAYEDVLVPYFEDNAIWIANPGYGNGPGDDVNDSQLLLFVDDHIYVEQ